jgi:hypothetical protein
MMERAKGRKLGFFASGIWNTEGEKERGDIRTGLIKSMDTDLGLVLRTLFGRSSTVCCTSGYRWYSTLQ